MAKSITRTQKQVTKEARALLDAHKFATGHRPHMTGGGAHDTRPRGQRDRAGQRRAAIADARW